MELFFLCGVVFFAFVLSVFYMLFVFTHKSSAIKPYKLPPGKMGLPFLGESLQFISAGRKGHPEKFFQDRISKYASNVFKTSIIGQSTVIMCGAEANKFIFTNENKLVTPWAPKSISKIFNSAAENENAKQNRKRLSSFLKGEVLKGYIGVMDTTAQRHFALEWEGKQEVTVYPLAKSFTFWSACKLFLSIEDLTEVAKLEAPFHELISGVFSIPINLPGTPYRRGIKASNFIKKKLRAIIKQRKIDLAENKATPTQDILSTMLLATDENGQHINESLIVDTILGMLFAGHDTTTSAITSIVKNLAELPDIYEQVLKEQMEVANSKKPGELLNWDDIQKMKYSWNVACESMRLASPGLGAFRVALDDFHFQGFHIPKGWKLYWSAYATHKDSRYFPSPEKFDPSRFQGYGAAPYTFVPFGGGPRMCPGNEYARLQILVFMHNAVKRFKWEKIIPDERTILMPLPKPAKELPIRLVAREV